MVDRRVIRAEVFSKEDIERIIMRILALVGSVFCENQNCRKSKGSSALSFNRGLGGS